MTSNRAAIAYRLFAGVSVVAAYLLLATLATSQYNTLSGDDLYFVHRYETQGVIDSIVWYFMHWTGRVSNILLIGIVFDWLPLRAIEHFGIVFSTIGLVASLVFLIRTANSRLFNRYIPVWAIWSIASLTALGIAFFSKVSYDNFYWIVGVITYVVPLMTFNLVLALILRYVSVSRSSRIWYLTVLFFASLFMSLLNEVFSVQAAVLFIAWLILFARRYSGSIRPVSTVLVAVIIGTAIMRYAPGTADRIAAFATVNPSFDRSLTHIVPLSFVTAYKEIAAFMIHNWLGLLGSICACYLATRVWRGPVRLAQRTAIFISICATLLAVGQFVIMAFLIHYSGTPVITNYTLLTANYFMYCAAIVVGSLLSCSIKGAPRLLPYAAAGLCFLLTATLAIRVSTVSSLLILQKDEFLKQQVEIASQKGHGVSEVRLSSSTRYFSYCAIYIDQRAWCNVAASRYYGLTSIITNKYDEIPQDSQVFDWQGLVR